MAHRPQEPPASSRIGVEDHAHLALLASIVNSCDDAIISGTTDGIITSWNPAAERLYGYRADEMVGQTGARLIPTEHPDELPTMLETLREGKRIDCVDVLRVRKDGRRIFVSVSASPIFDSSGKIVGVFSIAHDITQRRRAEEQSTSGSQYVRSLIEANPDPLAIINTEGKITDVNEATIKATGVERDDLIGTDFSNYFTEPDKARNAYRRAFAEGFVTDYPLRIQHRDGRLIDVLYNASVFKDGEGDVMGVCASARDVTAQKKAGDGRAALAAIVDSTTDAVIGKSLDGVVMTWNKGAERMFGYTAEEIIGRNISELVPKPLRNEEQAILDRLGRGDRVEAYETQRIRKDGQVIDIALTASPVRDQDGRIVGASKIARDITDQKQASQYARMLIEVSLDPLVTISAAGKITDVNEAAIKVTGVPRHQLIGTDFSSYFTEPERAREGYQRVFSKSFVTDYPLTIRHRDGRLTHVLYNASVYRDVRGNVLGVFAAARDVTAQRTAEAEIAEQRSKVMERLVELERFQKLTVGRELKMIELKKEIEELRSQIPATSGKP